jgi:hypothetical protein
MDPAVRIKTNYCCGIIIPSVQLGSEFKYALLKTNELKRELFHGLPN